jgi:hypothetical protein
MSFKQLNNYLNLILGAQLVLAEYDGFHLLFKISGKGKSYLKTYAILKSLMEQPSMTSIHPKVHER